IPSWNLSWSTRVSITTPRCRTNFSATLPCRRPTFTSALDQAPTPSRPPASLQLFFDAINQIADRIPVLFPAHPRTAQRLAGIRLHDRVQVIEPLGYLSFLGLMAPPPPVVPHNGGVPGKKHG